MCCRFEVGKIIKEDIFQKAFEQYHSFNMKEQGEVFPGDIVLVKTINKDKKEIYYPMKWGYSFRDKLIYNARSESAKTKDAFSRDYQLHRCVIACNNYYEFDKNRNKYSIKTKQDITYLAGIYRYYHNQYEFTILTKEPYDSIKHIHHRMPVIINKDDIAYYLNPDNDVNGIVNNTYFELVSSIVN